MPELLCSMEPKELLSEIPDSQATMGTVACLALPPNDGRPEKVISTKKVPYHHSPYSWRHIFNHFPGRWELPTEALSTVTITSLREPTGNVLFAEHLCQWMLVLHFQKGNFQGK